jgi:iron complex transport system ATP-binding protein
MASVAVHDRIPPDERVLDVVLTAAWSVVGRARESYEEQDERRGRSLLDQLGVLTFADRFYGTLSEGERKRVQIARALMTDPELLLLDEPAAGLDLGGREDLVRRLAELAQEPAGPATVLVTHHVEEIPVGFTHALLLRDGAVVAAGPVDETVTGEHLSKAFGLPLQVQQRDGRFTARAA